MASVKIFKFSVYDVLSDQKVMSRRMGTSHAIEMIRGIIDESTGVTVDEVAVRSDINGLTAIDYVPVPYTGGFQRRVE